MTLTSALLFLRGLSLKTWLTLAGAACVAALALWLRIDAVSDYKAEQAAKDAKQLKDMLDAGNAVDTTRDGLTDRLREGAF